MDVLGVSRDGAGRRGVVWRVRTWAWTCMDVDLYVVGFARTVWRVGPSMGPRRLRTVWGTHARIACGSRTAIVIRVHVLRGPGRIRAIHPQGRPPTRKKKKKGLPVSGGGISLAGS